MWSLLTRDSQEVIRQQTRSHVQRKKLVEVTVKCGGCNRPIALKSTREQSLDVTLLEERTRNKQVDNYQSVEQTTELARATVILERGGRKTRP